VSAQSVEKIEPNNVVAMTPITPMAMLAQAIERGMPVETVDKLMALNERWEAAQARKAFFEAFAAFKSEAIIVARNKDITDGPLKGKRYAELFSFVEAVTPALSRNGLSHSWEITKDDKDWIEVTCKIEHVSGHGKVVAMGGPPDTGGAKNAIQARVSTVTYLERVTLKAACGIAEQGDDLDGRAPSVAITAEQVGTLRSLIVEVAADIPRFCKFMKVERIEDIPQRDYAKARLALEAKQAKS
jgi:hypothetical protein